MRAGPGAEESSPIRGTCSAGGASAASAAPRKLRRRRRQRRVKGFMGHLLTGRGINGLAAKDLQSE
jgi:hypothetical protein